MLSTIYTGNFPPLPAAVQFSKPVPISSDRLAEISDQIGKLRVISWRDAGMDDPNQFKSGRWWSTVQDEDPRFTHYGIFVDERLAASARISIHTDIGEVLSEEERAIVGDKIGRIPLPAAWLSRLAVHPDFKRHGLARRLCDQMIEHGIQHGAESFVGVTDPKIMPPFVGMGFEILGDTESFFRADRTPMPAHIIAAKTSHILNVRKAAALPEDEAKMLAFYQRQISEVLGMKWANPLSTMNIRTMGELATALSKSNRDALYVHFHHSWEPVNALAAQYLSVGPRKSGVKSENFRALLGDISLRQLYHDLASN